VRKRTRLSPRSSLFNGGQPRHAVAPLSSEASDSRTLAGRSERLLRVDLHVHTNYSPDSLTSPTAVAHWAKLRGLSALAITDHNTIEGALAVRSLGVIRVIVGEEISTPEGELIGLFLNKTIPPQPSLEEAIQAIRAQRGVVYAPHPCDRVRGSAMGADALTRIAPDLDIVECLNARVTWRADNAKAHALATELGISCAAGSDAHQGPEIGHAYTQMPFFEDAPGLLRSIARATLHGHESSPLVHAGSTYARVVKQMLHRRQG
jgi:predicted metal-dependent phosphoesterase TrpH